MAPSMKVVSPLEFHSESGGIHWNSIQNPAESIGIPFRIRWNPLEFHSESGRIHWNSIQNLAESIGIPFRIQQNPSEYEIPTIPVDSGWNSNIPWESARIRRNPCGRVKYCKIVERFNTFATEAFNPETPVEMSNFGPEQPPTGNAPQNPEQPPQQQQQVFNPYPAVDGRERS